MEKRWVARMTITERPFRFRAWSQRLGEMAEFEFDSICADGLIPFSEDSARATDDGVTVMQSTGLKDATGREIFEGDVVQKSSRATARIGVVEWREDGFMIESIRGPYWYTQAAEGADFVWGELVVIGNAMETPELLSEKEKA